MAPDVRRLRWERLFEVQLLHHFWLDDGIAVFDALSPAARASRLLTYDVRRFLAVHADPATARTITGLGGMFRSTGLGLVVAVPVGTAVPVDTVLEFFVTVVASDYASYTALSLVTQPVVEVVAPPNNTVHRYKANVPVLSNITGTARPGAGGTRLFLSQPYVYGPASADGVEELVEFNGTVRQLTGDGPSAPTQALGPSADHPIYVHQGDVPPITAPPGAVGAPDLGVELGPDTPRHVAMVIRIGARSTVANALSLVDRHGQMLRPSRVFEVHLRNRWTAWRYYDRTGGLLTQTNQPFPLTDRDQLDANRDPAPAALRRPSTSPVEVERDPANPSKIRRLVSDVYP